MMNELKTAQPGQVIWDREERGSVKGLHVKVTATGKRVFLLYYRTREGKERRPKIGELGQITVTEARRRAQAILDEVAIGRDPQGEWTEKRAEMTVSELFEATWKAHWSLDRYASSGWGREVRYLFEKNLRAPFGSKTLSEVSVSMVRDWHRSYLSKPYAGNRALAVLAKMFNFAEEQELRPQHSNPCNLVKKHSERKRRRYATADELRTIVLLLEKNLKKNPEAVAFIYLLMFTGSRPRAIERATWKDLKEFDVDGQPYGVLTFKGKTSAKTGDDEKVIVPPQAMRALYRLPRIEGCTLTGIKIPRAFWEKIRVEAGCPDLWARDLRRTFATVGMSHGVDLGTIGELLNHRSSDTTKIYAKLIDTRAVQAVTTIAGKLEQIIGEKIG